ncbi:MAG: CDF family Co(II)/Ni(II) efflux transporter DmeF [Gemmatimonadota bacterium]
MSTDSDSRLCDQPRGLAVPGSRGEQRTRWVVALTGIMMVAEIAGGLLTHSMALLADGWHMGTHLAALGLATFAYWYARRHAHARRFTFGTGKVSSLGGFASAVVLGVVALLMVAASGQRLLAPAAIRFDEAMAVAGVGLAVNVVSALLLRDDEHGARAGGESHHRDHNLRAAYVHVIADALTSVTALVALLAGKHLGWVWMDPAMGIVGALVVGKWAAGLMQETARVLLDAEDHGELVAALQEAVEADGPHRVQDLHVWRIGPGRLAALARVATSGAADAAYFRSLLEGRCRLAHVTVEVVAAAGLAGPRPAAGASG